jgi:hypothetical protein
VREVALLDVPAKHADVLAAAGREADRASGVGPAGTVATARAVVGAVVRAPGGERGQDCDDRLEGSSAGSSRGHVRDHVTVTNRGIPSCNSGLSVSPTEPVLRGEPLPSGVIDRVRIRSAADAAVWSA